MEGGEEDGGRRAKTRQPSHQLLLLPLCRSSDQLSSVSEAKASARWTVVEEERRSFFQQRV